MKQKIAIGIVAVALVGGSATGLAVRQVMSDDTQRVSATPSTTPSATPAPTEAEDAEAPEKTPEKEASTSTPTLLPLGSMQITTGAVGPVQVGMSQEEAAATGYFNTDVPSEGCEGVTIPLEWKSNYFNALDLWLDQDAQIASIGVRGRGPKTRSGLGVNSSYGEVRDVIGDKQPEPAGYGQTGLFVNDGDAWIGFLFDVPPETITDADAATFIEVTRGAKPGLMRDGC